PEWFWLMFWRLTYTWRLKKPECEAWRMLPYARRMIGNVGEVEERAEECARWLMGRYGKKTGVACAEAKEAAEAAGAGSIALLKKLRENGCNWSWLTTARAAH